MKLRIVCREDFAGAAAHGCGGVETVYRTFDIEASEPFIEWMSRKVGTYDQRTIVGVEVLDAPQGETKA